MTSPIEPSDPVRTMVALPRPPRRLRPVDRLVRVPIGFLYLIFIVLLAVPVLVVMTTLYAVVRGWARLIAAIRRSSNRGAINGDRGA